MNVKITLGLAMLTLLPIQGGDGDDWNAIYNNTNKPWIERWGYLSSHAESMPPEIRFEILPHLLGNENNPNYTDEQKKVARNITRVLLDTPGHAEYFGNKIRDAGLDYDRSKYFHKLQFLPSSEAVGVLGGFLSDESGRPTEEEIISGTVSGDEIDWRQPNSDMAAKALLHLLDNPPGSKDSDFLYHRDLGTWQLWWERVKAGNQTFRFKGDPQEYTLEGPVREGAPAEAGRERKRTVEGAESLVTGEEEGKVFRWVSYAVVTLVVLAGVVMYFLQRKRNAI